MDSLHGIVETNKSVAIICDIHNTSIEEFLNLGKKNEAKIFILHKSIFSVDSVLEEIGIDEEESNSKTTTQIKKLKKYEGQVEFFSIVWMDSNVVFEYAGTADWLDDIEEIKTKINEANEEDGNVPLRFVKEKELPQSKVKELSKLVAEHPDFFINQAQYNQGKLKSILSEILIHKEINENTIGYFDQSNILSGAKAYFDKNLLQDKEKEMTEKIEKMKEQGLSKIAIRSKLGISEGMLNRYYY